MQQGQRCPRTTCMHTSRWATLAAGISNPIKILGGYPCWRSSCVDDEQLGPTQSVSMQGNLPQKIRAR